jgi:DNA-binding MarR family transcriptional regulator
MHVPERADLIAQIVHDQRQLRELVWEASGARWTELDLTMAQLKALVAVADAGCLPVGQLGARLGIGKPHATLLVDALVRRGLVERREDPADRRRTLVRLSARGRQLIDDLILGRLSQLAAWLGQLDDDDLAALARGLRALVAVASAIPPTPRPDGGAGAR